MSDPELFLYMVLGIMTSVIMPNLWKAVREYFPKERGSMGQTIWRFVQTVWRLGKKYVILAICSMVTGVLLLAIYKFILAKGGGIIIQDWWSAFLSGYGWDSIIQRHAHQFKLKTNDKEQGKI